jgi:hypothetical protein
VGGRSRSQSEDEGDDEDGGGAAFHEWGQRAWACGRLGLRHLMPVGCFPDGVPILMFESDGIGAG